uniref:Uncharacterized protein n=1 Tax=Cannabis sativa TaxID=3483 RepID=A0A803NKK5_CANSA
MDWPPWPPPWLAALESHHGSSGHGSLKASVANGLLDPRPERVISSMQIERLTSLMHVTLVASSRGPRGVGAPMIKEDQISLGFYVHEPFKCPNYWDNDGCTKRTTTGSYGSNIGKATWGRLTGLKIKF